MRRTGALVAMLVLAGCATAPQAPAPDKQLRIVEAGVAGGSPLGSVRGDGDVTAVSEVGTMDSCVVYRGERLLVISPACKDMGVTE